MAQEKESKPQEKLDAKKSRDRSPAYPAISLKSAIDRLTAFEKYFQRHAAPLDKVGLAWDIKEKSSQAFSILAALKSFGLVEYGEGRIATLSIDGRNYLRAQQDSVKQEILKRSALKPKAISTYWVKWGADRPPDPICLDELVLTGGFNHNAAPSFLKIYDDTIAYSGLANSTDSDILSTLGVAPKDEIPPPPSAVKVGDIVTWESGGVVQFDARRVTGIAEAKDFVFVEGSATGVPIKEVTIVETSLSNAANNPSAGMSPIKPPAVGARQDVFSLDEGQVILQWPSQLSAESYEDFESWIQLQLRKIKRSIN